MKENKGSNGIIIGIVILVLMFMSYAGNNLSDLYSANYSGDVDSTAYYYAFINVVINLFCIALIPLIIKIFNKGLYYKHTKSIYVVNGIIWILLSIPLFSAIYKVEENGGFGLIGTTVFSIAVYNLLRGNTKKKKLTKIDTVDEEQFKCDNCGSFCGENDKYCKNCHSIFEEEEDIEYLEKQQLKCDNCGALVNEDDTECPNCGEEFEEDDDIQNIYNSAMKNEQIKKFDIAEKEYNNYILRTEQLLKNNEKKAYTFNNCVEFTIAIDQGLIEKECEDLNYETSNAYMHLGFIEFERKNYDNAVKLLNKSLKYNPCNVPALFEIAECYKIQKELTKYYNITKKIYDKIYDIFDLAHYYRNLGYYYIEKENWDLAKAVYLYSLKYDNSPVVLNELNYIVVKSSNEELPSKEKLTRILKENELPTFISKKNNNIIKMLHSKIIESGEEDSNVGKFLQDLLNKNANL